MGIKNQNITIGKLTYEYVTGLHEAITESRNELYAEGMLPQLDMPVEEIENWVRNGDELWESDQAYFFVIIEKSSNQVVGQTWLNHVNRWYQMANLGYWVRTNCVGNGIATASAKLAAQHGFEQLGFQRLEIVVRKDHLASLMVAKKIGAVQEGLLRNRVHLNGSTFDAYMLSLIPSDFGIHETE